MNKERKFSIILPVYNVENYLEDCLDSIYNQTYKNIELIVVNDGSTDSSLNILKKYQANYLPDMIILNQENKGLSEARNRGLELVTGDYIYFLDSDDYIDISMFEKIQKVIEKNEVDLLKFDAMPFLDNDGVDHPLIIDEYDSSKYLKSNTILNQRKFLKLMKKNFLAPVWLYCVKADIILNNQLIFKKGLLHEDELFTPELFLKCKTFYYINEMFFYRRYRENSIMTSADRNMKSIDNYFIVISKLNDIRLENKDFKKSFINSRKQSIAYIIVSLSIKNEKYRFISAYRLLNIRNKVKIRIKELVYFVKRIENLF